MTSAPQDHSTSQQRRARPWADPHLAWALAEETEALWDQLGAEASELTGMAKDVAEAQAAIATKDAAIAELTTRLAESEAARAEWEQRAMATAIGVQPVACERQGAPAPDDGPFHHAIWDEATETEQPKEPAPIVEAAVGGEELAVEFRDIAQITPETWRALFAVEPRRMHRWEQDPEKTDRWRPTIDEKPIPWQRLEAKP